MKTLLRLAQCAFLLAAATALAQTYPAHSITLVVPFSAGGPTDTIARIMAERMSRNLGQTIVVENVTGAGGSIAVNKVAHATPDGYTVGIGHIGTHVMIEAMQQQPFDVLKDLEPVGMIAVNPQIIITRTTVPANNLKELVAWIKANQSKVSQGTGGMGTPAHITGIYFQSMTGTKFEIIHYRGAAPAIQDLIAGHTDFMIDQAANSIPQVRGGKVKAFAVTAPTRLTAAPDSPTVDEAGLPGLHMAVWHGLWVPRGTPKAVIAKLNAAMVEALADPAVQKRLVDLGQDIPTREQQSPEGFGAYHKAETEKWWPIIKAAGIKSDS
jgi:tripartite-type tricarboxylate transporter receptor subunit TctC